MSGGGALGLGKSKSQQQAEAYSEGGAYGTSMSESGDVSGSTSQAIGGGTSRSTQSVAFEDLYAQMFGGASGAAARGVAGAPELAAVTRQLFSGGMNFMDQLGDDAGSEYLEDRLSGDNPVLNEQIQLLEGDVGRLFSEQLNPAITSRAVAGGTLGGGRQGVAQGMAMEVAAREFARGATALRSDDIARRDAAAMSVAQNSLAATSTGLGALPTLVDLASAGNTAELDVYTQLAGILGGPTVLSESNAQDFSRSTSESAAQAFSRSFGTNQSWNKGTSSSSGKASGWNFNMSGYGGVGASGGG